MTAARMISLSIPGRPVPWSRAGSNNGKKYTPKAQQAYMATVGTLGRVAMARAGYEPFTGPVELTYRATYRYPETWSAAERDAAPRWHARVPDSSNLVKLVEDALNGICFNDDCQVQLGAVQKVWGAREVEGAIVTITDLTEAA